MKNAACRIEQKDNSRDHSHRAGFSPSIRHPFFVSLLLLLATLFPTPTFAQPAPANRWLLIFDTSSSMRSRAKGTKDIMQELLSTDMHGQIRHGDTIGIWTFNDKLHAGEAPLQVWSPEMAQLIYRHTSQYLEGLHYSKSADMQAVLTNMFSVVDGSDFITVILFSDGGEPIKGTPFDDQINAQYKQNYREQRKADKPFVTVLQARHGNFTTNTVNFGPWPVEIPPTPSPAPPKPPTPQTPPGPTPATPPTTPPIIFDGRKNATDAPAAPPPTSETNSPTLASADNSGGSAPTMMAEQAPAPKPETAAPVTTAPAQATQPAAPPAEASPASLPPTQPAATPSVPAVTQNESQAPPSQPETTSKQPAAPPFVATATSAPTPNFLSTRNIAIGCVAFAVILCTLLLMSTRRSRTSEASLITRSLDRENQS